MCRILSRYVDDHLFIFCIVKKKKFICCVLYSKNNMCLSASGDTLEGQIEGLGWTEDDSDKNKNPSFMVSNLCSNHISMFDNQWHISGKG